MLVRGFLVTGEIVDANRFNSDEIAHEDELIVDEDGNENDKGKN